MLFLLRPELEDKSIHIIAFGDGIHV